MDEYIERDRVINILTSNWYNLPCDEAMHKTLDEIKSMPFLEIPELYIQESRFDPENGSKWDKEYEYIEEINYRCSRCGLLFEAGFNFCPHCGAKMINSEEEDDEDERPYKA